MGSPSPDSNPSSTESALFDRLLPALKEAWRLDRGKTWSAEELGELSGLPAAEVAQTLERFAAELELAEVLFGDDAGLVGAIQLSPAVLETEPFAALRARLEAQEALAPPLHLSALHVDGFGVLRGLDVRPGPLTVLTGEPGSGKSALLECLALLSRAMRAPLPSGPDAHLPERLHLSLRLTSGSGRAVRYAVSLGGPAGVPRVTSERLAELRTDASGQEAEAFTFLERQNGQATVRTATWGPPRPRVLQVPLAPSPDALALSGELDPALHVAASVRAFVSGWRFYPGFDVSRGAVLRRPVPSEPEPVLAPEGSNLSAVLFHLMVECPERWRELETLLRAVLPSFHALSVKPRGGAGTVLGVWREAGVRDELTLAHLSDGTLRLLCLAALCLSPLTPPLLGLDGPELGLPPRALPVLASLLRRASESGQVLVATHSPELLAGLPPESVAVLEKVDGRAVLSARGPSGALG